MRSECGVCTCVCVNALSWLPPFKEDISLAYKYRDRLLLLLLLLLLFLLLLLVILLFESDCRQRVKCCSLVQWAGIHNVLNDIVISVFQYCSLVCVCRGVPWSRCKLVTGVATIRAVYYWAVWSPSLTLTILQNTLHSFIIADLESLQYFNVSVFQLSLKVIIGVVLLPFCSVAPDMIPFFRFFLSSVWHSTDVTLQSSRANICSSLTCSIRHQHSGWNNLRPCHCLHGSSWPASHWWGHQPSL